MMREDELALLVTSYAEQALRGMDPALTFQIETEADDVGSVAYLTFGFKEERENARPADEVIEKCARLIFDDANIQVVDAWADDQDVVWLEITDEPKEAGRMYVPVEAYLRAHLEEEEEYAEDWKAQEEEALAEVLDLPGGKMDLRLEVGQMAATAATQLIVIGLELDKKVWVGEIYHHGTLPDLERAEYWAAKHERTHEARGFRGVTSVVWQGPETREEMLEKMLAKLNETPL